MLHSLFTIYVLSFMFFYTELICLQEVGGPIITLYIIVTNIVPPICVPYSPRFYVLVPSPLWVVLHFEFREPQRCFI